MIAAHRGHFGGNIVQNTQAAFESAIRQGADIIELDVIRSTDGEFYCFHDGCEQAIFGFDTDVRTLSSSEIDGLTVHNVLSTPAGYGLTKLGEALRQIGSRALVNIDRAWPYLEDVLGFLKKCRAEEQVLVKSPVRKEWLRVLETCGGGIMFMPILTHVDEFELVHQCNVNTVAVELIFPDQNHGLVQRQTMCMFEDRELLTFVNAIDLGTSFNFSGGLTDTGAILEGEAHHWGVLVRMGFTIIQTDWPLLLEQYLLSAYKDKNGIGGL